MQAKGEITSVVLAALFLGSIALLNLLVQTRLLALQRNDSRPIVVATGSIYEYAPVFKFTPKSS